MKIVVMGSGGLGGLYGARLAHAGCDVTFVARGEHLAAMSELLRAHKPYQILSSDLRALRASAVFPA